MNLGVRFLDVQINNIKNVKNGYISFNSKSKVDSGDFSFEKSDVIGIYGPNGSSKTSMIESFDVLKSVIISRITDKDDKQKINRFNDSLVYDLIAKEENEAIIKVSFFSDLSEKRIFFYELVLGKNESEKKAFIKKEKMSYKTYNEGKWTKESKLLEVNLATNDISSYLTPATFITNIRKIDKNIPNELLILLGASNSNNTSFIFSNALIDILNRSEDYKLFSLALKNMRAYAVHNMHVYNNREISQIAAIDAIPFFYKNETENSISTFFGKFNIFGESAMHLDLQPVINEYFKEIDIVISKIIPNLHVEVVNLGKTILENGDEGFKCEVVSIRNGVKIPLRLESDGIKKIISLISAMVDIFNNKYSILIVDEFDSGVFEYLLGELLIAFKSEAKGQFLFTSHNLRALEVIKDSIIFSSLDEEDRYISYPRISKTENLRNQYLKKLFLDNDNNYAEQIDTYDIYRSFVKAGELISHE